MEIYIIDRFEGAYAICECTDRSIVEINFEQLPQNVKEGDVITFDGFNFIIDEQETQKRRQQTNQLQNKLFS